MRWRQAKPLGQGGVFFFLVVRRGRRAKGRKGELNRGGCKKACKMQQPVVYLEPKWLRYQVLAFVSPGFHRKQVLGVGGEGADAGFCSRQGRKAIKQNYKSWQHPGVFPGSPPP